MTAPTTIKHGSAHWWVLQTLKECGPTERDTLKQMGTHETPRAMADVRALHMIARTHDGLIELTPKGRNALAASNKQRRSAAPTKATSRSLCTSSIREPYEGKELAPYNGRPGAMVAYSLPSRMGDKRVHYRTGEVIA